MPNEIPTIQRTGIMFRPGDYGAKGIYTDADMDALAGDVNVPIKMSHYPTLLDGKLGTCERAFVGFDENGKKVLMGQWAEPKPLADLLGDTPRSLSVEIDLKNKSLAAVALEVNPHIKDAAFFSQAVEDAYAKFSAGEDVEQIASFAFESASERDLIPAEDFGDPDNKLFPCRTQQELRQCLDELANADDPTAVKARLTAIAERKGLTIPTNDWRWSRGVSKPLEAGYDLAMYSNNTTEKTQMSNEFKGRIMIEPEPGKFRTATVEEIVAFTGGKIEVVAKVAEPEAAVEKTPREIELETKLAKFEADTETERLRGIEAAAVAKTDALVDSGVVAAKGNEDYNAYLAAFTLAGRVDSERETLAFFSADSPHAKFSLTGLLDDLTAKLPKHDGTEQVSNLNPAAAGGIAVFEQNATTVTDPESAEIVELNKTTADKIIEARKKAAGQ